MDKHGFFITLFMSVVGGIFIIGAAILFCLLSYLIIDKFNIKRNGIIVEATITVDNSIYRKNHYSQNYRPGSYSYDIEYMVNGEKHQQNFMSTKSSYDKGDVIQIYCLENNPNKVFVPQETGKMALYIMSGLAIIIGLTLLGWACIKNYNIFKYKRVINVE